MQEPNMLYRCPGPEVFEGVSCETTIVDADEVEAKLADGWHRIWTDADAAHKEALAKLAENEAEQARIAAELAGAPGGTGLKAVHKGRGVWDVVDAAGVVVQSGLSGDDAKKAAGG